MISQLLAIARNTFTESLRQPVYVVLIIASGLFQALNTAVAAYSMGYTDTAEVTKDDKLLLDIGMGTIFVIGTLLAAFQATSVISREIVDKTVLTVVAKPVERPTIVLGKFLGVSGAIAAAVIIMITFLLFAIRHEVLSTAADDYDQPVLVFCLGAVGLSLALATWGNFFYGWSFPQVSVVSMLVLVPAGYVLTLLFSKEWEPQAPGTDFKPAVFAACMALGMAILVLTSIATAASTRLGQVMTIVVCAGVFLAGLLSNHVLGRHAFSNDYIAEIESAEPQAERFAGFDSTQSRYNVELVTFPELTLEPGRAIWYGPDPTGFTMAVPGFAPLVVPEGQTLEGVIGREETGPAVVVGETDGTSLVLVQAGGSPVPVQRPPQAGDFLFVKPTRFNTLAMAAWGIVPNMHYFWLLDAVSQNRQIPAEHLTRVAVYSLLQIGVFLSLAVVLFQRRDVG
jgi:hypothetical protein